MTATVFSNVFDPTEINTLIEFYDELPISNVRYHDDGEIFRTMKHSQYNLQEQAAYQILHPKISAVLGPHQFSGGHYMDSHLPFQLHVDSISAYEHRDVEIFDAPAQQNRGVLIPLSENTHFHTMFFEHYTDRFDMPDLEHMLAETPAPDLIEPWVELMDHHDRRWCDLISRLTLDCVAEWHIGDVISWPRNQLHCSSNFAKHGLTKQAIVIWI
jgi:hypothetical protein